MLLGDAEVRVRPLAQLARQHEREHARHVGLERRRHQVVHQPDVLLERIGHADRRADARHLRRAVRLGLLDAPLDFADVVEILADARRDRATPSTVCRSSASCGDRVEDAASAARARAARLAAVPAWPNRRSNTDARVDLHRQRRGRRAPRDRVQVRAAEPRRAGADVAGEVLGRHFERRQRRVLADLLGDDLIDRRVRQHVLGFGPLRPHAGEEAADADGVIADLAARMRSRQVLHDDERVLERLERLQDRRELEAGAGRLREELVDDGAVRNVDGAEPQARRRRPRLASGVSAGTIASRNGSAMAAPMPRRNVRRGSDILEMYIRASNSRCAGCCADAHLERRAADDAEHESTRTGSRVAPLRARSHEPPACRARRGRAPARRSAVFPSSCGRTRRDAPSAPCAASRRRPPSCRRPARPTRRSASPARRRCATRRRRRSSRATKPIGSITLWQLAQTGLRPVLRHLLAHRLRASRPRLFSLSGGMSGGGGGTGSAEDVVENPLAAHDRRGPLGVRRHGEHAALAEQPEAALVGQRSRGGSGCRRCPGCRSAAPAAR